MSDPIEVLRDLRDRVIPAALRHHASGPGYIEEAQEIVNRTLASLSAPKPESAEAVFNCPTCPVSVQSRWQEPECPECGERCYLDPTAVPTPPRPEASAPVGVERLAAEWEKSAGELNDQGLYGCCAGTYEHCAAGLRALAQQPAADTHNRRLKAQLEQEWANLQDLKRAYQTQQPAAVDGIERLTEQQAVVVTGYTGVLCCEFDAFHADLERRAGRPVFTHEMADSDWIKTMYRDDFLALAGQQGGES